jgi:hypothetical protein
LLDAFDNGASKVGFFYSVLIGAIVIWIALSLSLSLSLHQQPPGLGQKVDTLPTAVSFYQMIAPV